MAAAVVPFPRCGASEKKPRVVPSPFERARVSQRSEGADQQHTTHKAPHNQAWKRKKKKMPPDSERDAVSAPAGSPPEAGSPGLCFAPDGDRLLAVPEADRGRLREQERECRGLIAKLSDLASLAEKLSGDMASAALGVNAERELAAGGNNATQEEGRGGEEGEGGGGASEPNLARKIRERQIVLERLLARTAQSSEAELP